MRRGKVREILIRYYVWLRGDEEFLWERGETIIFFFGFIRTGEVF